MRILAVIWAVVQGTGAVGVGEDILFALDGRVITEVLPPIPVRPLPAVAPWVRGVTAFRGATVPVIDTRQLLGFEPRPIAMRNRLVVVPMPEPHEDRRLGLWVDAILDVRPVDFGAPEAHPGVVPVARSMVDRGVVAESGPTLDDAPAPDLLGPLGPTPWGLAQLLRPRQLFDDAGWSAIASRLGEVPA